jgi:diguanylate cyclase (GGDEF)-like protein/PAS domain S-box-containing protein
MEVKKKNQKKPVIKIKLLKDRIKELEKLGLERKKMEEELRESKQRFEAIFDGAVDGLLLADLDTRKFNIGNRRICEMLGYERDEIKQIGFDDIHPKDALPHVLEQIGKQVAEKITVAKDLPVKRKNGSIFYADVAASPLRIGGKPFLLGIFRDTTERKKAEEDLRKSEERFRALAETSSDMIWEVDKNRVYTYINQKIKSSLGYDPSEMIGKKTPFDVMTPEDKVRVGEIFRAIAESQKPFANLENWNLHKDGRKVLLETSGVPVFDSQGQYAGYRGIDRDITVRKQAEEALKESEQKFRAIFDKASDGMFLVDLETRKFLMCNAMCLQTLGYAQEEFLNLEISDIHPKDDLPLVFEQIAKYMKGEEGVRHDLRFRRKDGSLFFSDLSPALVTLAGRKFILIVYKDITERIQIQDEKRQANEKLTVFVKKLEDRNYQNIILSEMREMLQACSKLEEAPPIIKEFIEKLFPNLEGALFMMNPSRSDLESVARWGDFPEDVDDNVFAPDACWALRRGRTYIVENVSVGALCPHLKHPPSSAYMCLPLIAKSDVLGLLHLRSRQFPQIQSEQNFISGLKEMAVILSEYLSLSIANIQLNERLARQSVRDPLTGLFNRRFMIESLEREIKRAERNQTQVGIIMADIDHFKQFNDKYGHAAGDEVLTQMGGFFRAGLRGSDVSCRYGGEEFVFFLPESSAENTFKRADQMREEVKNLTVHYGGELLASITLSMGISTYPDQGSNAEDLLRVADAALYRAKQEGRDRVHYRLTP